MNYHITAGFELEHLAAGYVGRLSPNWRPASDGYVVSTYAVEVLSSNHVHSLVVGHRGWIQCCSGNQLFGASMNATRWAAGPDDWERR